VAGWIRDVTGSYDVVIVILMVSSGLVSAAFIGVWHAERRHAHRMNLPIPA
jgi:cyanate permease